MSACAKPSITWQTIGPFSPYQRALIGPLVECKYIINAHCMLAFYKPPSHQKESLTRMTLHISALIGHVSRAPIDTPAILACLQDPHWPKCMRALGEVDGAKAQAKMVAFLALTGEPGLAAISREFSAISLFKTD